VLPLQHSTVPENARASSTSENKKVKLGSWNIYLLKGPGAFT